MMPAVPLAPVHAKSDDEGRTLETAALAATAWGGAVVPRHVRLFCARAGSGKHGWDGGWGKPACRRDCLRRRAVVADAVHHADGVRSDFGACRRSGAANGPAD